ncbi:hypothetical protein [Nocardioides endophyticus]
MGDLALALRPMRLHPAVLRGSPGDGELRRTGVEHEHHALNG